MFRRIFLALYLIVAILLVANFQAVADWWFLRSYEPSQQVEELADASALNERGRRLFYVSDPSIDDKLEFSQNCPVVERSQILGCYTNGKIYILDVERPELEGIMEVTAAHEMLHAAYARLSGSERERIDTLLEEQFSTVTDKKLRDLIAEYEQNEGAEVRSNELHSILPTQLEALDPELEEYYGRYFNDRSQVVELHRQYEAVFQNITAEIEALRSEVQSTRDQLAALEGQLTAVKARIDAMNAEMQNHRRASRIEQYNALVPQQNALVSEYNGLIGRYRNLVAVHNRTVAQVNDLVLLQNDLVDSIDSSQFERI